MSFRLKYHPDVVADDIPALDARLKARIRIAIESRFATAPNQYGEPLRKTLKGYWKLRVGNYRIFSSGERFFARALPPGPPRDTAAGFSCR